MKKDNTLGMGTCSNIRLSVVIPVYNAEQYIGECLKSTMSCNNSDIEVLLVDDGSTDKSGEICDKYSAADARIHVFHKMNGGVSSARNFGIEKAKGKWITFVDADDQATSELISFIPDNQSDLYCFNWQYTTGETENESLTDNFYGGHTRQKFLEEHLADYIFRTPWAKIFKRSIIIDNNLLFNESFKIGEDNLFMLDYLRCSNNFQTISTVGYIYLRPNKGKYPLPLKKATDFMTAFMEKYDKLRVNCCRLLLLLELYYFMSLHNDSFKMRLSWEKCSAVRHLQDLCWSHYGKRDRISMLFRRTLIFAGV